MLKIVIILLCCFISVHVEARATIIMGQQAPQIKSVRQENDAYGIHMNGNSDGAPLRSDTTTGTGNMFLLPRKLNEDDNINVTGVISNNSDWFSVSLVTGRNVPDYNNIAGQIELSFPNNTGTELIVLTTIVNGAIERIEKQVSPTQLIPELNSNHQFSISITIHENTLDFYVGESYVESISLAHNVENIRYLTLSDTVIKVDKLEFTFA